MAKQSVVPMLDMLRKLKVQRAQLQAANNIRKENLATQTIQVREGYTTPTTPAELEEQMKAKVPGFMSPGNMGDLHNVIWPFWFTFSSAELAPNTNALGTFTVTQEASFIWMAMTKTIYLRTVAPDELTYIDPDVKGAAGATPGLEFTLRDAQSSRVFMQLPIKFDHIGAPRFPTVLPRPMLFLPNSTVQIEYVNNNAANTYLPYMTFFGYRLRLDGGEEILSTIFG